MSRVITIAGQSFDIGEDPFTEGHVLTANEAKHLNQTRAENIRNNMAKKVKELAEKGEDATAIVLEYASQYDFSSAVRSTRTPVDPVEKEALRLAKEQLRAAISAKGYKVKDFPKDQFDARAEELAQREDFIKAAKKSLAEKRKVAESLSTIEI